MVQGIQHRADGGGDIGVVDHPPAFIHRPRAPEPQPIGMPVETLARVAIVYRRQEMRGVEREIAIDLQHAKSSRCLGMPVHTAADRRLSYESTNSSAVTASLVER